MNEVISISGVGSVSPLGRSREEVVQSYGNGRHFIESGALDDANSPYARLSSSTELELVALRESNDQFQKLDRSVLMAILATRTCMKMSRWTPEDSFGINIGSSRGATALFETYHEEFLKTNKCPSITSPSTTLGNISTWVAHDVKNDGPVISHSITCSTALHAVLNGVAWIRSGMATKFLVGGSEAPLTPFTLSQMKMLRLYSSYDDAYPCKPLDLSKSSNSMVLGEGAAVACLEKGVLEHAIAVIEGLGYATEKISHPVSISTNANCFQKSMRMALGTISPDEIDAIITHSPGTVKGDQAEVNAIKKIFGENIPVITSNKWKIGHTFAASGMLSLEMAILMLEGNEIFEAPNILGKRKRENLEKILINAVGFGGNAVSILIAST